MYFFDTYALVELLVDNPSYKRYGDAQLTVSALNIGEFYLFLARTYGAREADKQLASLTFNIVELTQRRVIESARFKLLYSSRNVSWADCAGYVIARELNLKFLTGDVQFKGMPNVEFVK